MASDAWKFLLGKRWRKVIAAKASAKTGLKNHQTGNRALRVGQMGRDFLLLDTSIDRPPAEAVIVLRVDESERRWSVRLPEGISAGRERVRIELPACGL